MIKKTSRTNLFISYSHKDTEWLKRLQVHLKPLEQDRVIDIWDDTRIQAGSNWRKEIKQALTAAKVAVLLVSADFLASEFISANELPPLLKAAREDGILILPIIVSPSLFAQTKELQEFQTVNSPDRPLIKMKKSDREQVFLEVAKRIFAALPKKTSKPRTHSNVLLEIRHIIEHQPPNSASRVFDIIIANLSKQQLLLTKFDIRWQYHHGMQSSIAQGMPLRPVADYVIKLRIITDALGEENKVEPLDPVIAVPPANTSGPSLTTLRLQICYYFAGRIDWHPCSDWDIFFSLSIWHSQGGLVPVFSRFSWRTAYLI